MERGLFKIYKYRPDLDESHGAANITTMNDEFDNKNHYYNYNEDNVLISYGYGDVNDDNNNCLKVEKISDESTVVTFVNKNNGSKKFEMQTDICKDDNVLLYPKIKSIGQKFKKYAYGETIDYSYDGLGRMNKKNMRLCYEWVNMPEDQLYDYYVEKNREFNHNSNLIKKANTKIVLDSMSKYEVNYNYGYDEKNNAKSLQIKGLGLNHAHAYQIKKIHKEYEELKVSEATVSAKALLKAAKERGVSLTVLITAAFICAIHKEMHKTPEKKPVTLMVPVNLISRPTLMRFR